MPYIKGINRSQISMFPETIDEYIDMNNPVRVIDAYVNQLDLEKLGFKFSLAPGAGRPPYDPRVLIKLYIYGYINKIRSSRRLEDEASRNIELIWLLNKLKPDFKTIADFRKDNKKAIKSIFRDFSNLCKEWGLYGKELVAVDGSKFRASNSKKNNFSNKKLDRHIKYINEKINQYMKELDEIDKTESIDQKPNLEEINKRLKELSNRKEIYEEYKKELKEEGKTEISTTDQDARLMSNGNKTVDVSYNVQTTVDAKHKLIVDFEVTQNPNDLGELDDMAIRAKEFFEVEELTILADKGYYKAEDLKKCVENGITPYVAKQVYSNGTGDRDFYNDRFTYDKGKDTYVCPAGKELHYYRIRKEKGEIIGYDYRNFTVCKDCDFKSNCTKSQKGRTIFRHRDQDFLDTINIKTEQNMDLYKQRQMIVEHPFGTIKRGWGAYYFLTRGIVSVSAETSLSYFAYNLKRVINILGVKEIIKRLEKRVNPALI